LTALLEGYLHRRQFGQLLRHMVQKRNDFVGGELMKKEAIHSKLRVRRGTVGDIRTMLSMIRALAEYERLASTVKATAARIRRDGFGRRPHFETLICQEGKKAVGFALYFFTYSTFLARPTLYVEDLFVLPELRGKGAGKSLLVALARIAVQRGCGRMEWTVLDWNARAIKFYKRLGASLRKEWILTRLTGRSLRRMAHSH
jgi:GNAT superfamily N-acetyltransferase